MKTRGFKKLLGTIGIFCILGASAFAAPSKTIKFATQSLGTTSYVYASTMAQMVEPALPEGYKIDIQTISTGGVAAPLLIGGKQVELALGNSAPAKWGAEGGLMGRPKIENLRSLIGGFDAPFAIVVFTDEFVKKTGIKSLDELVAKKYPVKIAVKAPGGFGELACKEILDSYGVSYDMIKSWGGSITHTSSPQIVDLLRDGKADITIDHVGGGQSSITELAMTTPVHFMPLSDAALKRMNEKGWDNIVMPKDTWKNQDQDIKTINSSLVLLAADTLPEEVAYAITKKLCESKAELGQAYASMQVFDPSTAWEPLKAGAPLHPGAERYYREMGYIKK